MSIRRLVESMGKTLSSQGARLSRLALEPLVASLQMLLAYGVAYLRSDWRYWKVISLVELGLLPEETMKAVED